MMAMRRTIARIAPAVAQAPVTAGTFNTGNGSDDLLDLYCFPYAGVPAWAVFDAWANELPADVRRGVRFWSVDIRSAGPSGEQSVRTSLGDVLDDLLPRLAPDLRPPFIFIGHSMGALVSFEMARALRRTNLPRPEHLIVSGHRAPQLPHRRPPVHAQPDSVLLKRLRELDGTPPEVLQEPELLDLFLPRLRSDLSVCESYDYAPEPPLSCSITALGGTSDPEVTRDDLLAWSEQTAMGFSIYTFPGGHFFPQTAHNLVLRVLTEDLRRVLRRLPQAT
jgi:medium-chain acyl-[acyl-carrier-protein] hydrolase